MIFYRDQNFQEWLLEMEKEWYKDGVYPSRYAAENLKIYLKWIIRRYKNRHREDNQITILEPGCRMGESGYAIPLLSYNKVIFSGMEISDYLVGQSKKYHNYSFKGDICNCPEIPSDSFDIVFCRTILGFLKDIPMAIKEMIRITRNMLVIIQSFPVASEINHYAQVEYSEDITKLINFPYKIFSSIPVYDKNGNRVFGEQIILMEK